MQLLLLHQPHPQSSPSSLPVGRSATTPGGPPWGSPPPVGVCHNRTTQGDSPGTLAATSGPLWGFLPFPSWNSTTRGSSPPHPTVPHVGLSTTTNGPPRGSPSRPPDDPGALFHLYSQRLPKTTLGQYRGSPPPLFLSVAPYHDPG